MGTYSMETPPAKSGRYVVHHGGVAVVLHYLDPNGQWLPGTKTGWRGDLSFLPTHWSDLPHTPRPSYSETVVERAERLIRVYGNRPDLAEAADRRPYYLRHPVKAKPSRWQKIGQVLGFATP